jgi:hypothetical protein
LDLDEILSPRLILLEFRSISVAPASPSPDSYEATEDRYVESSTLGSSQCLYLAVLTMLVSYKPSPRHRSWAVRVHAIAVQPIKPSIARADWCDLTDVQVPTYPRAE